MSGEEHVIGGGIEDKAGDERRGEGVCTYTDGFVIGVME